MGLFTQWDAEKFDDYVDTLLANGFTELRIDVPDYNTPIMAERKEAYLSAIAKGAKVIWGVSSNPTTITAANWSDFRQAILDAATWAQANGVYEFQIGNEEENHVDGTTMTITQIITNLRGVATDVKAIFTNGNVSYSTDLDEYTKWTAGGKGDLDILALNIYLGGNGSFNDNWKTGIDAMVSNYGVDGTYITEFGLSWSGLDDYSEDEAVQAAKLTEMIDYIKDSGITRAFFFTWVGDTYGVLKDDQSYRQLWNSLLNSD